MSKTEERLTEAGFSMRAKLGFAKSIRTAALAGPGAMAMDALPIGEPHFDDADRKKMLAEAEEITRNAWSTAFKAFT
jgi:hypothetical protein